MSDEATPEMIIDKSEGGFVNVYDSEAVIQKFYMEKQEERQPAAEYGMKLKTILQAAVEKGDISQTAIKDMLRTKFWSDLRDSKLKNASRCKYETKKTLIL